MLNGREPGAGSNGTSSLKIVLASRIDPGAISRLQAGHDVVPVFETPDELPRAIRDRDVLIFRSGVEITRAVLSGAPSLRLIVRAGSGFDNIDLPEVRRHGVRLVRIPGPGAQAVAELTMGLLLSVARNVTLADRLVRQGRWPKPELGGPLLRGKVLGIVGAGNIGSRVGELGAAWGMRPLGCVSHPTPEREEQLARAGIGLAPFDRVLAAADFLTVHASLNASSHHLLNRDTLARMKPGAFLVNTARGPVVDEAALYEALAARHLAGAALDVHEREGEGVVPRLAELPNVVLTPHIGAMAIDAQRQIGERVVELIDAFVGGRLEETVASDEIVV